MEKVGEDALVFIAANKCDWAEKEEISMKEASVFAKKYKAHLHQTSAKDGTGIHTMFKDIAEKVLVKEL